MSTLTLNITYQGHPKRFTVSKSQTISQFITQCLTSYNVDCNTFSAELYHNNKALDSASPFRLTNLSNNAKLTLKVKKLDLDKEINVKFISEKGTVVRKFTIGVTLEELVEQVVGQLQKPTQLRILDLVIGYEKYTATTLVSVVGNANSVVIRLEYPKSTNEKDALFKKQQEANRLQLAETQRRQELERQKRIQEEEKERERKRIERESQSNARGNGVTESAQEEDAQMKDVEEETPSTGAESVSKPSTGEKAVGVVGVTSAGEGNSDNFVYLEEEEEEEEEPIDETPKLYVPSNKPQPTYQNPDEDYNMTIDQAKTYQNVIRNSAKRVKKIEGNNKSKPSKYFIRVKFPDGAMLQINFIENVEDVKFGNLVKRIDELLIKEYIDNYNLKIGYPPFTKLNQSFALNNEKLHNLEHFQSEQVVLIWELSKDNDAAATNGATKYNQRGPFLNNESKDLVIKPSDELPAIKLEKHRKELKEGDSSSSSSLPSSNKSGGGGLFKSKSKSKEGDAEKDEKKSKLPKWLKMKK
ncbi:hypothetical protein KGF57_004201 [Candida theae]|uniref:TUG ubiquitin-like domain-containing protein n=1 Tax=Candida theae TaxID=1198502 RepID=A0AAD5BBK1_9ASCO|nr:uncharacterized protein KGF57_004201 [Candida theae]KAI5952109.1 hypothetical protein KGF57_004201 [Candida theae]